MSYAATCVGQSLPADLQFNFDNGQFSNLQLLPQLPPDGPIRRWQYSDNQTGEDMFLLEYQISGNSALDDNPINQLFWLTAQQRYDAGLSALITLYHNDQEAPSGSTLALEPTTRLSLTPEALLMGMAQSSFLELTDMPTPGAPPSMVHENPFICLAEGCYHQSSLNLVGIRYELSGNGDIVGSMASLLPQDSPLLFNQIRGFPGFPPDAIDAFDESLNLFVSPLTVPEPGSFSLLGAAVAMMAGGRRRLYRLRFGSLGARQTAFTFGPPREKKSRDRFSRIGGFGEEKVSSANGNAVRSRHPFSGLPRFFLNFVAARFSMIVTLGRPAALDWSHSLARN